MNLRRARDMLSQKKEKKKYTYFKKKTIGMNRNQVMRNHEHANRLLVLPSFDVGFLNHYRCPDISLYFTSTALQLNPCHHKNLRILLVSTKELNMYDSYV